MKYKTNALKFIVPVLILVLTFVACDKEFNDLQSDVLGQENLNFATQQMELPIVAYNKKLDSVQINNLASNLLGVYDDPVYGLSTASIVSQITPTSFNPDFGTNTVIDSVVMKIPYFSKQISSSGNIPQYSIRDSLFGEAQDGSVNPIKLSVYSNNYYLRDYVPFGLGSENSQMYYSYADAAVNENLNKALNGSNIIDFESFKGPLLHEDLEFKPSANAVAENRTTGGEVTTEYSVPALRVHLDTTFWSNTIFKAYEADNTILRNANNFRNYFRGIYIKAEPIDQKGNMILLNIASSGANIVIYYHRDSTETGGDPVAGVYTFTFNGNRLNTFINQFDGPTLQNGNSTDGDEKLYLKGMGGSMAVVDLFRTSEDLQAFIDLFRLKDANGDYVKDPSTGNYILKRLINEAQLVIYEDETMAQGPLHENGDEFHKYDRLYAYDLSNNQPTVDYSADATTNERDPFNSKFISLGQRIANDGTNYNYKIRLTEQLKSLLIQDNLNTKIGIAISNNVNSYGPNSPFRDFADILNSTDEVKTTPSNSLLSPRGTVVYGSNTTSDKKLVLKLFYTEEKQ
ncbi:DUF4270 domain-containing protein [Gaetbulibacter sp. M240]|uniref:DUF4270 domain-containing protein n=1 Tax=Gaetbulibacter sp. M240 TaxID=3126511 RepID=UPI00374E603F